MPVTQQANRDKLLYYRLLFLGGAEGDRTLDLMTAGHEV